MLNKDNTRVEFNSFGTLIIEHGKYRIGIFDDNGEMGLFVEEIENTLVQSVDVLIKEQKTGLKLEQY